ncbi:nicotinate-nucleotide--dimethylbenzimidazole phosphoribosyltransferase [Entomobacter blattae]|uniref:Nicotinate-nucleotide--dimethylbenzimidazole phosphoribosyltransferase n=1 Tax=Entomobacter blattae TaxID=2762277 RepID=A0A7H1NQ17_9PROT|nr:nicotinate-nucleotide--dimethylbenzimidazole phosphoribosyltransferase [Entomobacter blattae]QNT77877.1 Nicotinate-nucleotide--dimethylbenzimidazole phosphoribosyltransferase [Entomobacter blattae]
MAPFQPTPPTFTSLAQLQDLCLALSTPIETGQDRLAAQIRLRLDALTKPPGSLGRLEELVVWLGLCQRRAMPTLQNCHTLIFAGNHGVTAQNVSPYPQQVTAEMVKNFHNGGAAINQLTQQVGNRLQVITLNALHPTRDFSQEPAMSEQQFLDCVATGYKSVPPEADLLCLGEMGIGNTTAAAALSCALFEKPSPSATGMASAQGSPSAVDWAAKDRTAEGWTTEEWAKKNWATEDWVGAGTGLSLSQQRHKAKVIETALTNPANDFSTPFDAARIFGGFELAALLGATLAARNLHIPLIIDGFVCTAALAPLWCMAPSLLDHCQLGHLSAEKAHAKLAAQLNLTPLLHLGMRLGEGSGAVLSVNLIRAALSCYRGMKTFDEAHIASSS